jgi:hypothetical protein
MAVRELRSAPNMLALYGRAAASMLPGASRLPLLAGGGGAMPRLTLTLEDVAVDPLRLVSYKDVCEFGAGEHLPCTYPHILAFPLHMALMTEPAFPFTAVGLVHIENTIVQRRPLHPRELLTLEVSAGEPQPHRRGQSFEILTLVRASGELVWEERSVMLRRESSPAGGAHDAGAEAQGAVATGECPERFSDAWILPGNTGRRYAAVSGDRNPIHMSNLSARAFGFPRAIAHGMWSKARCMAALEPRMGDSFAVSVSFRKPVALPARLAFTACTGPDGESTFQVLGTRGGELHLTGELFAPEAPA